MKNACIAQRSSITHHKNTHTPYRAVPLQLLNDGGEGDCDAAPTQQRSVGPAQASSREFSLFVVLVGILTAAQ
jgi:hypothetical protein